MGGAGVSVLFPTPCLCNLVNHGGEGFKVRLVQIDWFLLVLSVFRLLVLWFSTSLLMILLLAGTYTYIYVCVCIYMYIF